MIHHKKRLGSIKIDPSLFILGRCPLNCRFINIKGKAFSIDQLCSYIHRNPICVVGCALDIEQVLTLFYPQQLSLMGGGKA